ncbi:OmpA family protein [Daejeonella rubra]|uniref:OmpA family protein n=1 Tax=Daejeonella rubra TaxID=990371 RepID=A0A1G9S0C5_9SPHI|nr:OmpA family protein [Daejeonella rubra]SDM28923.1 OmpA family protein [Daejeonella rubra]
MKNKLFIIAVFTFSGISFLNTTTSAQNTKMSLGANRSSSYMAINSASENSSNLLSIKGQGSSEYVNFESEKVKMSTKAMYMASEQFVFDNLSSLKSSFKTSDIYFDLDDASIRPDALPALNSLVTLLNENPGVSVAVSAFSDSRMAKYNDKLAFNRAQAARTYLISKGISANRLVIEKHGRPDMSNPCNSDPNCSLALQQINRRTEFNILFNGVNLGQVN